MKKLYKKIILIFLIILLLILISVQLNFSEKNEKRNNFIDTNGPDIYDNHIIWSGGDGNKLTKIYIYNISSQELKWIDGKYNNAVFPKIYKKYIFWDGVMNTLEPQNNMYAYNIETDETTYYEYNNFSVVCDNLNIACNEEIRSLYWDIPKFSEKYIVWWNKTTSDKYYSNISSGYLYDKKSDWYGGEYIDIYSRINQTKYSIWVSQPAHKEFHNNIPPVHSTVEIFIYDSIITFNADRGKRNEGEYLGKESVYLLDLDTMKEFEFINDTKWLVSWPIYEDNIIWNWNIDEYDVIKIYDIESKTDKIIYETKFQISQPKIFKNYIVWWEFNQNLDDNIENNWIYLYDINTKTIKKIAESK